MTFNKQLPFQVFEIVSYNNDQVQLINIDSKQFEHLHYVPESRENLITSAKTQKNHSGNLPNERKKRAKKEKNAKALTRDSKNEIKSEQSRKTHCVYVEQAKKKENIDFYKFLRRNKEITVIKKQNGDILLQNQKSFFIIFAEECKKFENILFSKICKNAFINQNKKKITKLHEFLNDRQLKKIINPVILKLLIKS